MANALYGKGREAILAAQIDWVGTDMRIIIVDLTDYTLLIDADDNLDDVGASGTVAESSNLSTKTETLGVADADNVTFSSVTGDACDYVIGFEETGTENTSQLIFNIDTASGIPVTPNGGDITVTWDNGSDKIFKL